MATYAPLLTDNATRIVMMKATGDPNTDGNWANVDGHVRLNRDSIGVISMWAVEDSSDIHIATQSGQGSVHYHVFDPGTDTWTTKNEFVVTDDSPLFASDVCSIALRTDGDVIILYTGDDGGDGAVFYARKESGSWTTGQQVDGASGTDDYRACVIVPGVSDRMHFFYSNFTNNDILHRSLSSANSLDTADQAVDATPGSTGFQVSHGVSYLSGGNTKIRAPYLDASNIIAFVEFDSGADPTISTTANVGDAAVLRVNLAPISCASVDGTEIHLLFSVFSDFDIFHDSNNDDAGWGTDSEEQDAVTANRISCNVYTRAGINVLAYLYLDGTTSKYAERNLTTDPELGVQPSLSAPTIRHLLVR